MVTSSARVVVGSPGGDLCVLDGDTGAVLSRWPATLDDVLADTSQPGGLVTLQPGEAGARLVHYRLRNERLEPTGSVDLEATTGGLLWAGETVVGLLRDEGTRLFQVSHGVLSGNVWPPIVSAAVIAPSPEIRLQTVDFPDEARVRLRLATIREQGIETAEKTAVEAPRGVPALFATGDGFGRVDTTPTGWRVVGGPHDGFHMEDPDEIPAEARMIDAGRLVILTGPEPRLWVLSPWGAHAVELGGAPLDAPGRVEHRIAFDAGRQRVWVVAGGAAYAVELPAARVVATAGCQATAIAVLTPAP